MTDKISELHPVLEHFATDGATEPSPVLDPHESGCITIDDSRAGFTWSEELTRRVNEDVARFLIEYSKCQMSSVPFSDDDSGTITDTDMESIFDYGPGTETDWDTNTLSSFSQHGDFDPTFFPGIKSEDSLSCGVQAIKINPDTSRHSDYSDQELDKNPDEVPLPGDPTLSTLSSSEDADSLFSSAMISIRDASPPQTKRTRYQALRRCGTPAKSQPGR
ncbi:hypothetical protein B0H19DRAFT_1136693 [Mycena capillaripes]|nr:hypothetical protein B0H19DRAFT_1136693 [Mycena capillaripes]